MIRSPILVAPLEDGIAGPIDISFLEIDGELAIARDDLVLRYGYGSGRKEGIKKE